MNSEKPKPKNLLYRNLLIVAITVIVTIAFEPWACRQIHWAAKTDQERYDDTTKEKKLQGNDSVEVLNGKIPRSEFEDNYGAQNWFNKFISNKVAFDKKNDGQLIDVFGVISKIGTEHGCSTIVINATDKPFENIVCTNCPQGIDKWPDEVVNVTVGQQVHIVGTYSADLSSDSEMDLYKCHIKN